MFIQNENLSFKDDIYFKKSYCKLYGKELFEFEFKEALKEFKVLALKERIAQSEFFDLQSVYGYSGFCTNSNDEFFLQKAIKALKNEALKQNIIAFFIRFHPFDKALKSYAKCINSIKQERKIIIVPTSKPIEQIRKAYSSRIKTYVNKARKELELCFCTKDTALAFKKLYDETMKRNEAWAFYFFDLEYFQKLFDFEESLILKASYEGEDLAFVHFFLNKNFGYYHLSANKNTKNANLALLDYVLELSVAKNISFVLLGGGVRDDDSLFYFKQKFSKLYTYFYVGHLIINEAVYTSFCQNYHNDFFLKYRYGGGGRGY